MTRQPRTNIHTRLSKEKRTLRKHKYAKFPLYFVILHPENEQRQDKYKKFIK